MARSNAQGFSISTTRSGIAGPAVTTYGMRSGWANREGQNCRNVAAGSLPMTFDDPSRCLELMTNIDSVEGWLSSFRKWPSPAAKRSNISGDNPSVTKCIVSSRALEPSSKAQRCNAERQANSDAGSASAGFGVRILTWPSGIPLDATFPNHPCSLRRINPRRTSSG
ncbi:hypothetical protein DFS28_104262 [Pseudomonas sp. 478]|nr:hypothetical protein DFS28_104262 [Pseudomonas sp. 478]TCV56642.1 hypothetical protein EDB99_101141 [Pseudomonas sp. 460]